MDIVKIEWALENLDDFSGEWGKLVKHQQELATKLLKMLEFLYYYNTKGSVMIKDITPELNYIRDLLNEARKTINTTKENKNETL